MELSFLVEKAKSGDAGAFGQLYGFYSNDMYRFALYYLNNTYDAEDAVQEAAVSAWKNIDALNDNSLFKAWLFKILLNKCKNILLSKNKMPDMLPEDDYTFLLENKSGESSSFKSCEILEALNSLTPPDGQIILLSVIGGFKSGEISKIFGIPPGTVRSKQKRAYEKLKNILKDGE